MPTRPLIQLFEPLGDFEGCHQEQEQFPQMSQ